MKLFAICILLVSLKTYSCFDDLMNYYPCDDTNEPLNYTPLIFNPLTLYQSALKIYNNDIEKEKSFRPFDVYVPTSDFNNEELLRDSDMAEVIEIDIEPIYNAPEIEGLLGAEVIEDPYEETMYYYPPDY